MQNLPTCAEHLGAPAEVVHRLNQLPSNVNYASPDEVVEESENIEVGQADRAKGDRVGIPARRRKDYDR